jgi:hypothetical protein
MRIKFFRKWLLALHQSQIVIDIVAIWAVIFSFLYFAPPDILNALPATGGDTGSHYWPLHTLVHQALPNWHIRVWNPGNLGGEPHLTHYFPLPYLLMAFLSLFVPLGTAFNIGSIFPVIVFPICVYYCFRGLKMKFPTPLLAMAASLSFLYNESFSMWGGNTLSTLAGQFAHVYAFNFFLLGIGCLKWEMGKRKTPWISMWLFSFVLISHFYVALLMPIVFLVFLLFEKSENFKERLRKLCIVGVGANLLSIWFILPMLHNSPWNTAFGLKWGGANLINEILPKIFWPFLVVAVIGLLAIIILKITKAMATDYFSLILLVALFVLGSGLYFIFPKFGLVDVRVIPALQLALVLIAAVVVSQLLNFYFSQPFVFLISLLLTGILFWWPLKSVVNFPGWMIWNYSGWQSKTAYPDLQKLSEKIKGDFSMGRVIYENNDYSNAAGTVRVFEMLPYFAGRSTLESVYMQATVLAPAAFYLQAVISKTPSCPFPNYQCTGYDVRRMKNYSQLMGISDLILITQELRDQADQVDFLEKSEKFGGWYLYSFKEKPHLVEKVTKDVSWTSEEKFKADFYDWFRNYKPDDPLIAVDRKMDKKLFEEKMAKSKELTNKTDCDPQLKVEFDQMTLQTKCPGQLHVIKFAFHPTWKASSHDPLFLVSPGFIALFPSQEKITLKWGQHWIWDLADLLSWMTALSWLCLMLVRRFSCRKN